MLIPADKLVVLDSFAIEENGFYEIHAEVQWKVGSGYRFFHARHDPVPPCISENIEANILYSISDMKQRMTGHALLEMGTKVDLEVWSTEATEVKKLEFEVISIGLK